jgi:hypothetical protein
MPNSRIHFVALVAVLTATASCTAVANETPSVPQRVGRALERAGEATGHGLKRGVEATSHGVEVGVKATTHGLSRAGQAVEHGTHKAAVKVRSVFDK